MAKSNGDQGKMSISFELSSKSLDFSEFLFTNHTTWQRQILGARGPVMAKIYILEERTEVITQLPQISSEGKKRIRKRGGVLPGSHNRHDVDLPLEPQRPLGPCVG